MRWSVPLLGDRVAPRCTSADGMLLVTLSRGRVVSRARVPLAVSNPMDLVEVLRDHQIDTLVCGGIRGETREVLDSRGIRVIENVACSAGEVLEALERGRLRPGYGFTPSPSPPGVSTAGIRGESAAALPEGLDCLACENRVCLRGENCLPRLVRSDAGDPVADEPILEAAADVSGEVERKLCRISELIYLCLELGYRRIGLAFCLDLLEPAEILARVLRRFFQVVPVCCKIGGLSSPEAGTSLVPPGGTRTLSLVPCNPVGQARVLNRVSTDLNVIVGLCVGADCVFARESEAPVTTLFVKDKSLANNPIGAIYSEYYLRECATPASELVRPQAGAGQGEPRDRRDARGDPPGREVRS